MPFPFLSQPPSFKKKRNYALHEELGAGTFGKVIRATWTKPSASDPSSAPSPIPAALVSRTDSSSSIRHSMDRQDSKTGLASVGVKAGEKRDVALKVIPKKKVKGNEDAVWGEMDVLRGLDHPNIVRISCPLRLFC